MYERISGEGRLPLRFQGMSELALTLGNRTGCRSFRRYSQLPPQEADFVSVVLDDLLHRTPLGVSGLGVIVQKNRVITALRVLQQCGHLSRMQRSHTGVGISGH